MKPAKKISFPGWLRVAAVLAPLLVITGITYRYMNKPVSVTEIIVPYGERRQVTLPDGSEVWLSAGSTLQYPEQFAGDRIVRLSGEAYFSVKKDPSKAFIVETRFQTVRVLGTEFMVTAYPDEDQSTTALVSGKVQVSFSGQSFFLSPGRQITLDHHTYETKASRVLADDILSRRSGRLIFNHATLPEILRAVERQYKVKIQASGLSGDSFSVRFVQDETFEQVMSVLEELSGGFEWTRQIEN